jgi:hypothetical protein
MFVSVPGTKSWGAIGATTTASFTKATTPETGVASEATTPETGVAPETFTPEIGVTPEVTTPEIGVLTIYFFSGFYYLVKINN